MCKPLIVLMLLSFIYSTSAKCEQRKCSDFFRWQPIDMFRSAPDLKTTEGLSLGPVQTTYTLPENWPNVLKKLNPSEEKIARILVAWAEDIKAHPHLSFGEIFTRLLNLVSVIPPDELRTILSDPLYHTWSFFQLSDLTLMSRRLDELLREGDYESWWHTLSQFQSKASLQSRPLEDEVHPSWWHLERQLGLIYAPEAQEVFNRDFEWISEKSLRKHFNKRTKEGFPLESHEDLLNLANQFLRSKKDGQILFRQSENILIKYDPTTLEIAVLSPQGKIITYYIIDRLLTTGSSNTEVLIYKLLGIHSRDSN